MKCLLATVIVSIACCAVPVRHAAAQPCYDVQKITSPDPAAMDWFGETVAIEGDTLVIGGTGDDEAGANAGAAWVFERLGGVWTFSQKLMPTNPSPGAQFGGYIVVKGDTLLVGARFDSSAAAQAGAAYVFTRSGGAWAFTQRLTAFDAAMSDGFGFGVAIEGNRLLIGAGLDDDNGLDSGSVYLFDRPDDSSPFVPHPTQPKLTDPSGMANDQFGYAIGLNGDRLMISAYLDDHVSADNGTVCYYEWTGTMWTFRQRLVSPTAAANDIFGGTRNGLILEGDRALIGKRGDDDRGTNAGSVERWAWNEGAGQWQYQSTLYACIGGLSRDFGARVLMEGDRLLIGASESSLAGAQSGSGHLFQRIGDRWAEVATLTSSDLAAGDLLGNAAALSGPFLALGATWDTHAGFNQAGSVYIFNTIDCLALPDCNGNLIDDRDEIAAGDATDVNDNLVPDECEPGICRLGGDADRNYQVNFADITAVLSNFNAVCP